MELSLVDIQQPMQISKSSDMNRAALDKKGVIVITKHLKLWLKFLTKILNEFLIK